MISLYHITVQCIHIRAEPIVLKKFTEYFIPDFYVIFPIIPAYLTYYSLIIPVVDPTTGPTLTLRRRVTVSEHFSSV